MFKEATAMTVRQILGELLKREFNKLTDELAVAYKGVDEGVAQQEIDAAIKQARKR
jgi:hypothetical protein